MNVQMTHRGRSDKATYEARVNKGSLAGEAGNSFDHRPSLQLWDSFDHRVTLFLSIDEVLNLIATLQEHVDDLDSADAAWLHRKAAASQ